MLNCTDPECILHHHHYYHGHVQHHLQDDRVHHEHPTHHSMSGESDSIQDAVIQDYLNDTDSELSSLSHLDAPNESMYMIGGVLIAMLLVGFIIILLAVTIRLTYPSRSLCNYHCSCCGLRHVNGNIRESIYPKAKVGGTRYGNGGSTTRGHPSSPASLATATTSSKLRKREESSGVHRSNVVHPEGVIQATVVGAGDVQQDLCKSSHLEDIFIAPVSNRGNFTGGEPENTLSVYASDTAQLPMFLYSTGNSRNSLNTSNDQDVLVHPSGPAEDLENNNVNNKEEANKKKIKGKLKKLVRRKTPPTENYALPLDIREQLKQIYVY